MATYQQGEILAPADWGRAGSFARSHFGLRRRCDKCEKAVVPGSKLCPDHHTERSKCTAWVRGSRYFPGHSCTRKALPGMEVCGQHLAAGKPTPLQQSREEILKEKQADAARARQLAKQEVAAYESEGSAGKTLAEHSAWLELARLVLKWGIGGMGP